MPLRHLQNMQIEKFFYVPLEAAWRRFEMLEDKSLDWYDRIIGIDKPSRADVERIFEDWKQSAIADEVERLRVMNFKTEINNRWRALSDVKHDIVSQESNPDAWFASQLKTRSEQEISELIGQLEDSANIVKESRQRVAYKELRRKEYDKLGVTVEALGVALWESIVESRPDEMTRLQSLRERVKREIPKPNKNKV